MHNHKNSGKHTKFIISRHKDIYIVLVYISLKTEELVQRHKLILNKNGRKLKKLNGMEEKLNIT